MRDLVDRLSLLHRKLALVAQRLLDVVGSDPAQSLRYGLTLLHRKAVFLLGRLLQALQNQVDEFSLLNDEQSFGDDS